MEQASSTYQDLEVWQKARNLVLDVYRATEKFPRREWYGLAAQMRSAAVSVVSNIAEGHERGHIAEYLRFVGIARASGSELETQLDVSIQLGFISPADAQTIGERLAEVQRMIRGVERYLRTSPQRNTDHREVASRNSMAAKSRT